MHLRKHQTTSISRPSTQGAEKLMDDEAKAAAHDIVQQLQTARYLERRKGRISLPMSWTLGRPPGRPFLLYYRHRLYETVYQLLEGTNKNEIGLDMMPGMWYNNKKMATRIEVRPKRTKGPERNGPMPIYCANEFCKQPFYQRNLAGVLLEKCQRSGAIS